MLCHRDGHVSNSGAVLGPCSGQVSSSGAKLLFGPLFWATRLLGYESRCCAIVAAVAASFFETSGNLQKTCSSENTNAAF
jgi:hypothetical protein